MSCALVRKTILTRHIDPLKYFYSFHHDTIDGNVSEFCIYTLFSMSESHFAPLGFQFRDFFSEYWVETGRRHARAISCTRVGRRRRCECFRLPWKSPRWRMALHAFHRIFAALNFYFIAYNSLPCNKSSRCAISFAYEKVLTIFFLTWTIQVDFLEEVCQNVIRIIWWLVQTLFLYFMLCHMH